MSETEMKTLREILDELYLDRGTEFAIEIINRRLKTLAKEGMARIAGKESK